MEYYIKMKEHTFSRKTMTLCCKLDGRKEKNLEI